MKVSDPSTRKKMTMKEFAELSGVPYKTFHFRLTKGYSVMDSATMTEGQARRRANIVHGMHESPEYHTWESMLWRCKRHPHYLKLGITVCERWKSFEAFFEDMGRRPAGTTLDRINGRLGYSPENCRWATHKQQSQNTSRNINLTYNGETKAISEWARTVGVNEKTISQRIERGYSVEEALFKQPYKLYKMRNR